ncbi:NAD-glutamate dehydrogenase [Alteriqipengyuania lutimaris]|uniref:Glutamate dehydrogenase n=1 Tax=Alteriqipengyuania lutimaris TaxID=1538146 RepID=A0A395LJL2_9SPHN|nr:NAD-glutamate dehydrogenase domain-containing protein [Alteriqipengyuania lutimaris]MBB3034223.1 glutamate dehydrogenase [Alteriqipengyuania lutimaris]RDS76859.1 glutamate dehydrogenase [Alteriqipengyuania lutimaris]
MAGDTKQADDRLLQQLSARIRESLLPVDQPFANGDLDEAANFVLETAARRPAGEPAIAMRSGEDGNRRLRIALINGDMPFLVDSVSAQIADLGLSIDRLVHPVLRVQRDEDGVLRDLPGRDSGAPRESMIYLETEPADPATRDTLEQELRTTLADVRAAVTDWSAMRKAMQQDASKLDDAEGASLLEWLSGGMLTQLGHLVRYRDGREDEALGICRASTRAILADPSFDRAFAWFDDPANANARMPLIVKANRVSNVHRRVPLDLFLVPVREGGHEGGEIVAVSVHAGIWTSAALATDPHAVPRLRRQLGELMDELDFDPDGHAGKALVHALTALPHDLVIGFRDEDVRRVATTTMSLTDRPRPRLALVEAPLARHLFAFVWLPRDLMSTDVRLQIQTLLADSTGSSLLDWSVEIEGGALALLRFVLDFRDSRAQYSEADLESRLQEMLRAWSEAVENELRAHVDPDEAASLARRYADNFPTFYRADSGAAEAALDIVRMRDLASHAGNASDDPASGAEGDALKRAVRLRRTSAEHGANLRLKIYQNEGTLPLSEAVPALENFGLRTISELPTPLADGTLGTIHDFHCGLGPGVEPGDLLERAPAIEGAIAAVLNGLAEDDPFNRLVLSTGLEAREAEWLRAIYRYLRQTGMGFTIYTVVDALAHAPKVTRALIALFVARHDPAFEGDREAAESDAQERIKEGLHDVAAINDDRLLRLYRSTIEAMLRTNAFALTPAIALSFKFDSAKVPGLPKPIPFREIFVYSRRVEGIHLRAGAVARGGLRWSDRRDDFRTEVLGLMKAQRVKNAVIVPTGAKGGFYPKQLPNPAVDRDGWAAEGQASYEVFIRSLLSITDNIVDDNVVHPEGVRILDNPDPYFVVAADKGTARFSDVANAIAESKDFWLDDAFASGGSHGYDHKEMGITARGAWVSVQRHFREMGVDVQTQPTKVVGCGDMSGDVFGNGMLLSKAIRLVAAFDHRHIFIDPDPDPAKSWEERKRLFELPRSSWDDYDKSLISKGGMVVPRTEKSITLSKQARSALGTDIEETDPETLISLVLKAPADLLWFGGIGTYVKAERENNIQVGDPSNDALRVNGEDLRAKVIGEGANLGVTQAGRIEYALAGGRLNTDFIDNSAGVDCSDNEVNIKIALAAARRADKLTEEKRNTLLASMTEDVAAIVLEDNRLQALAISIAEQGGDAATASTIRLIETLEESGMLDRRTEGIADNETFTRRAGEGIGLTRPELAVLLSSAKLTLQDAIEAGSLPRDPAMESTLFGYFPAPLREKFAEQIRQHRLRNEIIATDLANRIVNRMGMVHPFELAEEEGVGLHEVASAFVTADRLLDIQKIWDALDESEMPEDARLLLFDRVATAMRIQMADAIRMCGSSAPSTVVEELRPTLDILRQGTVDLLAAETRQRSARMRAEFVKQGAPEAVAAQVAHLFDLDGGIGIAKLASDLELEPRSVAKAFSDIGGELGLDWAQGTAALMSPSDVWDRLLVAGLARDFQQMRLEFLRRICEPGGGSGSPCQRVEAWVEAHEPAVRQFRAMIRRAQAQNPVAPATLAQVASQARNLLAR